MVAAAVLALAQVNQHLILASDNSSYVVLGQALALGRGYVMVNEPTAPAMNLYPPGYPLLLAGVLRTTGAVAAPMQAIVAMKLIAVLFYLACLPVLFALVHRRHGNALAALTTLLFAVNPPVVQLATEILSEMPFVFFTLVGVYLLERFTVGVGAAAPAAAPSTRRALLPLILAAAALIAAYYMRTAAMAILAAAPLYLLLKRRWRAGLALGITLVILALPWFLRSSAPPTPETPFFARSYIHQVLALAPYSDQTATPLDLLGRVIGNSLSYATRILPEAMFPHVSRLGSLAPAASAVIAILLLLGLAIEIKRGLRFSELAVIAYWLSLSLFVWVLGFRYIIITVPFALLYLLAACAWLAHRLAALLAGAAPGRDRLRLAAVIAVACVLAASTLAVNLRRAERNLRVTRNQTLAQVYADNPEWTRYLDSAAWLAQHTPADAVIMSRKPDLLYLLSARRTVEYPYTQDGAILSATLRANRVSYILEDAFTWTRTSETYLAPAMRSLPGSFSLVNETPPPQTRIWQVH